MDPNPQEPPTHRNSLINILTPHPHSLTHTSPQTYNPSYGHTTTTYTPAPITRAPTAQHTHTSSKHRHSNSSMSNTRQHTTPISAQAHDNYTLTLTLRTTCILLTAATWFLLPAQTALKTRESVPTHLNTHQTHLAMEPAPHLPAAAGRVRQPSDSPALGSTAAHSAWPLPRSSSQPTSRAGWGH